jgi:hypothetical protein
VTKTPFVFQALGLLGLEEILKLSEVHQTKKVALKKAAGGELISWDEPVAPAPKKAQQEEAKVLIFPKTPQVEEEKLEVPHPDQPHIVPSELHLWQRELTKDSDSSIQKLDAFKGYKRSTEMYVVKSSTVDGKDKIRFASTEGILVDKKQA